MADETKVEITESQRAEAGKIMLKWLNAPAVVEQQKLPLRGRPDEGRRSYAAIGLFYDCVQEVYDLGREHERERVFDKVVELLEGDEDARDVVELLRDVVRDGE